MRVFREDIAEKKYLLLVARMKFARGELSFEDLRRAADDLIATIEKRRDQRFGKSRRYRLNLCAAELIDDPL